ncbi:hypothetical protein LTR86_010534 [Recurvomyces mirabilis]|nr:hypothetical protein LTR86_010534 [Recurvomyces mirabilis]
MSGAEAVVGLVLGAIPLLISALEHWQKTSAVLAKWWHLQSNLKADLERLEDTRVLYNSHLEELLRPMMIDGVLTEAAFESMRCKQSDDMWKQDRIHIALRQRLGERYDRYTVKVVGMGESIKAYTETLFENDLDFQVELKRRWQKVIPKTGASGSTGQSKRTIGTVFHFESRRLKYSLPSKRRDDLLLEMEDCLTKLEKFLAQSDRISPLVLQQTRYQGPLSARALSNFWNHAGAIFNLIGEAWQCQCKRYHCACLWLKHRTTDTIELKIQLRYCHDTSLASPPWMRRNTHVKLVGSRPVKLGSGSLVTIQYPNTSSSTANSTASQSTVAKPAALKLQGLCKAAAHEHPCDTCLGALESDEHHYELFVATAPATPPADTTTLAGLISQGHFQTFTPAKRFEIALTLASSHLQLYSTPWLRSQWTSHDIFMSTSVQQGSMTLAEGPYVLARFENDTQVAGSDADRHLSLGALSIALMEICFCTLLGDTAIAKRPEFAVLLANDNAAISCAIRLAVAGRWFDNGDEVRQQVGDAYTAAVDWALHHSSIKADDEAWRREFLDNVVQPLQDTYNMLFEQRPKK